MDLGIDAAGVELALRMDDDDDAVVGVVGIVAGPLADTAPLASDVTCRTINLLLRVAAAPWRARRAVLRTHFEAILNQVYRDVPMGS